MYVTYNTFFSCLCLYDVYVSLNDSLCDIYESELIFNDEVQV